MKKSVDSKISLSGLADRLRERITDGTWVPGTQLRQDLIAKEFGTSHIPVREAFVQLQASGFVTIVPNRGAFVSAMTSAEASELTEMRVVLELLALDSAIDSFGAADEATARAILTRDADAHELEDWSLDNWAFHRAIYQASGKRHLLETLEAIWRKTDRYLRLVWQLQRYQPVSSAEHVEILDAVLARDRRTAKRLTRAHIEAAGVVMQGALRESRAGRDKS
ncbi:MULTISPECIES: GntR family transcriptional regulator [Burkholderia]|uniref:GntR family transcriptional regulator n=1 Tax=Burkholderia paludis TaxID=1506587 RepID=A0A6J5CWZ7_9BURK|nr:MULTISPECIES: GntR family transcriptional regulator [Burkholderia]CAB3746083.1 HTH-type transcriptional repressor GlaR [Burkholderia paludis]VWB23118.1 GntR family transcriptional regulator [Burkholderia paludis]